MSGSLITCLKFMSIQEYEQTYIAKYLTQPQFLS